MHGMMLNLLDFATRIPMIVFLLWLLYRKFVAKRPMPGFIAGPGRALSVLVLFALLGFAGCTNSDPLAVASGPVFALNPGHWQPLPQDLTVPEQVSNR